LTADPEVRVTADGKRIANLRVATSENWVDKSTGERKERSEFHRVVIFGDGLAGVAEKFLRKGSKALIEGQLRTRKWTDQQSVDHYATEVVLQGMDSKLIMLDGRAGDSQQHGPQQHNASQPAPYRASNAIQHGQPQMVYSADQAPRGRQLPPDPNDSISW